MFDSVVVASSNCFSRFFLLVELEELKKLQIAENLHPVNLSSKP